MGAQQARAQSSAEGGDMPAAHQRGMVTFVAERQNQFADERIAEDIIRQRQNRGVRLGPGCNLVGPSRL